MYEELKAAVPQSEGKSTLRCYIGAAALIQLCQCSISGEDVLCGVADLYSVSAELFKI